MIYFIIETLNSDSIPQCSKPLHSKVSSGFLFQDLESLYGLGKIQSVAVPELSGEKN